MKRLFHLYPDEKRFIEGALEVGADDEGHDEQLAGRAEAIIKALRDCPKSARVTIEAAE